MIKAAYFPTIIYAKDVNLDNRLFEREVFAWSDKDKGLIRTNVKGWHSETNMNEIPVFKPLVDELFKMMNEIFPEEWLDRKPIMGNMWANINPPGGYNMPHVHPNSLFSGVYYVKTPPNCGRLICQDPRPGIRTCMPNRKKGQPPKHLWREIHLQPQENRAIMFNSWLWHNVEPNQSNDPRISVSFNFVQDGF